MTVLAQLAKILRNGRDIWLGPDLVDEVRADGSALDTAVPTEKAVRDAVGTGGGLPVISTSTTLYVDPANGSDSTGDGSLGNPWVTVQHAHDSLLDFWLAADVTIQVADGHNAVTGTMLTPTHPQMNRITVSGTTVHSRSMISVQSSSGSASAWSVVINLNNVTGIATGDYAIVSAATGGNNPTYIMGCHEIGAVDVVNNRITLMSKHKASAAPSGAVAATVSILKTVITTTNFGVTNQSGYGGLMVSNLVLVGPGTGTVYHGAQAAVSAGSSVTFVGVGIVNYNAGVVAQSTCSVAFTGTCAVSSCSIGMLSQGGYIPAIGSMLTGCTYGAISQNCGYVRVYRGTLSGNTNGCYAVYNGTLDANTATFAGNGTNSIPAVNTLGASSGYVIG